MLRGPLARSSLHLAVLPEMTALQRYAWVVDHLASLPGSGIVYTLTVADAERLTAAIKAAHGDSLPVEAYTGQLEAGEREHLEDALRRNEVKALVATSALGMGYDKPDLGFVVHLGAPASPVSYYQHIGRAGRAIEHAVVALLPAAGDEHIWDYFATATIPRKDQVESLLTALRAADGPMSVPALDAETGIRRTRVELLLKQLAVDGVVERSADGWSATGAQWTFDEEHRAGAVRGAALPMALGRVPHYADGLLLLGDAGGMISPFNGEGIAHAMESARLAAELVAQSLTRTDVAARERVLARYPQAVREEMGGYFRLGSVFATLIGHPEVMRLAVRYGLPRRTLMRFLVKIMAGLAEPHGGGIDDRVISTLARLTPSA